MLQRRLIAYDSQLGVDVYIKSLKDHPHEYILTHQSKLLPDWLISPQTLILVLFECLLPLDGSNLPAEQQEKDRLLEKFYQWGASIYNVCQEQKILTEIICPRNGYPLYSQKGEEIFHLPAIVTRHLSSFQREIGNCNLIHPQWGKAVYPSLILSVANPEIMFSILLEQFDLKINCEEKAGGSGENPARFPRLGNAHQDPDRFWRKSKTK